MMTARIRLASRLDEDSPAAAVSLCKRPSSPMRVCPLRSAGGPGAGDTSASDTVSVQIPPIMTLGPLKSRFLVFSN